MDQYVDARINSDTDLSTSCSNLIEFLSSNSGVYEARKLTCVIF